MTKGKRGSLMLVLLVLLGAGGLYALVRPKGASARADPAAAEKEKPVPVTATIVGHRDMPVYLDGLGVVQAYNTVTVKTQIDGQIIQIGFKEGQDVKKGDLLVQIDPRPYEANLEQAQAKKLQDEAKQKQDEAAIPQAEAKTDQDKAKINQDDAKRVQDEATLANAKLNLSRDESAYKVHSVPEKNVTDDQTLVATTNAMIDADKAAVVADKAAVAGDAAAIEAFKAAVEADKATVKADEAAINYARTQLAYTTINAPLSARVGIRYVDQGNIVHITDTTGIAVLTQLQPISVIFTLPQQDLPPIQDRMAVEKLTVIAVEATAAKTELDRGVLELIDNQIDPATGTIKMRATFPNPKFRLWPGGFVNVRLVLKTLTDATVVQEAAVLQGPRGPDDKYVYVIKPDHTVEARPIEITLRQDFMAVIKSGLKPGEQVVLAGQDRLKYDREKKEGTLVSVDQAPGAAADNSAAPPQNSAGAKTEGAAK